ncbi:MAG: AMP-binding protein [Candidatus Omnitrophota bacterium]
MNLGTSLHWVSKKMKEKVCIIEGEKEVSYKELWDNIELLADSFLKIGIKENDRVAIMLPNSSEFIYSFYALSRISAVSVPLNIYLTSHELKKIFNDCNPKFIITIDSLYKKKISSLIKGSLKVIFVDECEGKDKKSYTFNELFKLGKPDNLPNISTSNKHIATINYTYRGLGEPLGAMLTHGNYHYGAMAYVRLTELVTAQRVLLITPMSHIFTLISCVIVSLLRGATVVIVKTFIPSHIFRTIEAKKIDFMIAVPTVYMSLLKNYKKDKYDISSLKYGIAGGSSLSMELYKSVKKDMGIELFQGYGLTETVPVTCNPRYKNKPASLGIPGHNMKVKVVDEKGNDIPPKKIGEIVVGGPSVMKGYLNREKENKEFLKDGWFYTGDWGWVDEEGYIYFEGWKKDIVKVGGYNVDINEIKDTIRSFKGVKDIELDIIKDDLWGNLIEARVDIKAKNDSTEKDIRAFCIDRLSPYKIPRKITVNKL